MRKLPLLCLLVALLGFLLGLLQLFKLRFDAGDSYPPYSTYRTDPLGAKALYESLDALRPARRHLAPVTKLGDGRDVTLLWLGEDPEELKFLPEDFRALDTFVRSGGRLVLAMKPVLQRPRINRFMAGGAARRGAGVPPPGRTNAPPARRAGRSAPGEDARSEHLNDRWGFAPAYRDLERNENEKIQPVTAALRQTPASIGLPPSLEIHTALGFTSLDPSWRVLYALDGTNAHAVLIERSVGRGSVVLCADSFPFSNESLRDDRQPALLAWFAGGGRSVVFDETHLGVNESPGIATLARKYRLQTFFIALFILAALFIWKSASRFMPPYEEQLAAEQGEFVTGKDSAAGFVNLLRRNIAPANLMRVCLEQWNAHVARTRKPSHDKLEAMQKLIDAENSVEPRQRNPVGTYREFCKILSKRL